MSLKQQINDDVKAAMLAKDTERRDTIRLLTAAIKQKEVDERIELDDAGVIAVIDKMVKQRKDSIAAFEQGGRADLAAKEAAETRQGLVEGKVDIVIGTGANDDPAEHAANAVGAAGAALGRSQKNRRLAQPKVKGQKSKANSQ